MEYVTILGSTGSIGESTLRVIRSNPDVFRVMGLTCNKNLSKISQQIEEFSPSFVAIAESSLAESEEFRQMKEKYANVEFFFGHEGVQQAASVSTDIVVSAIVGGAGLMPSLRALDSCRKIALANKETLVMAGDIFMSLVREKGVQLVPVDSEHSAIFSIIDEMNMSHIEKFIITASGGSLRDCPVEHLEKVTPAEALKHPTWNMGGKITIDSATLMNKGFEVIEANKLFGMGYERIDVIIHPESVIHSMVETIDGSVYAHLGVTDMALPISNALFYPEKRSNQFGRLNLLNVGSLTFRGVDHDKYPSLALCYDSGKEGGIMPAVLNGANEVAVYAFLEGKIGFNDIYRTTRSVLDKIPNVSNPELDDIIMADRNSRDLSSRLIKEIMQ